VVALQSRKNRHPNIQLVKSQNIHFIAIASVLELMNATTKHYISYYKKELKIVGQDLPVQFTLTQLVWFTRLPLTHLGVTSPEMMKQIKQTRPNNATVHFNCKKKKIWYLNMGI